MKAPLLVVVALAATCNPSARQSGHQGHAAPAVATVDHSVHGGHGVEGYTAMHLDADQAKVLGLATATVGEHDFTKTVHTVGIVALDETRSAHVHPKVRGWIDGIHVSFVGKNVRAGDVLCSIYSQEVYSAQLEYLSILDSLSGRATPSGEFAKDERDAQEKLMQASKRRLLLWDVPESEVTRLATTRRPSRTFPLLAPLAGTVVAKEAIQGTYVEPSLELYTLSDLSRVWVLADLYETEVPFVHVGDHAMLRIEGVAEPAHAAIAFLAPTIDEATRTLKVRFELDNQAGQLRPGAFASIDMSVAIGRGLSVPESAVIRTGARSIVFVVHDHEGGVHVEPREVTLGPLVGSEYRVSAGVAEGDRVATGAQFLLDSESRLRATSAPGSGHVHH